MNETPHSFRLIGGRLCLDFVNTADWSPDGKVLLEKLETGTDLSGWCLQADLALLAGTVVRASVEDLRVFRSVLRRLFLASMSGARPEQEDLDHLNRCLAMQANDEPLAFKDNSVRFSPASNVQLAVGISAAALLTAEQDVKRVRKCPSDDCGWMFLDESRNRRRRWCAMETCGNRAKARRHYRRHATQEQQKAWSANLTTDPVSPR